MDNLSPKLLTLDTQLINELPYFETAIRLVVQDLRRHYAGLGSPSRCAGIYLLLGTTPENPLPPALARCLYSEEAYYIDMSQYAETDSAAHLRQRLTDVVGAGAHRVLVFGDIERSHVTVRILLSELFRNALLVDDQETHVDLTNCVLFLTTAVFAELLKIRDTSNDKMQLQQIQKQIYSVFERFFITPISLIIPCFGSDIDA